MTELTASTPCLPISAGFVLAVVAMIAILRARRSAAWRWVAIATSSLLVLLRLRSVLVQVVDRPRLDADIKTFYGWGRALWQGENPYDSPYCLSPPSALPIFALLSLPPFPWLRLLWKFFNLLGCALLVPLSRRVLAAQDPVLAAEGTPTMTQMACLAALLAVSDASIQCVTTGNLCVFVALSILLALKAQACGRRVAAGAALAVATAKVHTVLPFLLLFHRRKDLVTWAALGTVTAGLVVVANPVGELLSRVEQMRDNIRGLALPGACNDYSFQGPECGTIVALDHALYRLGLRDRRVISAVQLSALAALAAGLGWAIACERVTRSAACAVVALFASVFMYHRMYDLSILALPLTYAVGMTGAPDGRRRTLHSAVCMLLCFAIYIKYAYLNWINYVALHDPAPGLVMRLTVALVGPAAAGAILLSMILIGRDASAQRTGAPAAAGPTSPSVPEGAGTPAGRPAVAVDS